MELGLTRERRKLRIETCKYPILPSQFYEQALSSGGAGEYGTVLRAAGARNMVRSTFVLSPQIRFYSVRPCGHIEPTAAFFVFLQGGMTLRCSQLGVKITALAVAIICSESLEVMCSPNPWTSRVLKLQCFCAEVTHENVTQ